MTDNITIGVSIITRNRIEQLKRLLPQLVKFDQVIVCDTGSQDGTERYVRGLGKPFEFIKFNWRDKPSKKNPEFGFCAARNASWAPLKTTHALWIDTDDVIGYTRGKKDVLASPDQAYNVFKKIATEADPRVDCWLIRYVYSRDVNGMPNAVHARERMVKDPQTWRWVFPVHENLMPSQPATPAEVMDLDIIHLPSEVVQKASERNGRLLDAWLKQLESGEGNTIDLLWCRWNVGENLYAQNKWKECADFLLTQFIMKHPEAQDLEKWHIWCRIARCQEYLLNFEAARAAVFAAIDIEPGLSDPYYILAGIKLANEEDPQDILVLIDDASRKDEPPGTMITNPMDYKFTPYCIVSDCKYQLGQYDAALEWALKAQGIAPQDERAELLRRQATSAVLKRDAVESAKAIYQLLLQYDENEKATKLFEVLPYIAQQSSDVYDLANAAHRRAKHLYDRDEYLKLYEQNSAWSPAKEEWILTDEPPGKERYLYVLSRLKQNLPKGGRILDVGCSDGFHSLLYAKHGYEVVGVDLDKRCTDLANERAEKWGLSAKFVHGFFEEMEPTSIADPFDPTRNWFHNFDAVVCSEVIEHVQDPALLLGCLGDCVKDHAPVIITTPDEAFDKGDTTGATGMADTNTGLAGHLRVYTQETFEALLKSNPEFNVVESHFIPFPFAYRSQQGWQGGEVKREGHNAGPIIRIFCGDAVKFSPWDLDHGGIGGSETAIIHMARAWVQMGCQVIVYSGINGIYDGVFYRTADHWNPELKSDVFISWRIPLAFRIRPNAQTTILWCHDLYYPVQVPGFPRDEWPKEWIDNIDYIMVLSEFQKEFMSKVHKTFIPKMFVTRNGIVANRYIGKDIKKVPHRYFFSSSYDRGLEELLEMWPKIKSAIPDAELHVAYGIQTAEMMYTRAKDKEKLMRFHRMVAKMQSLDGVIHHERLGQQDLANLQLSCEAWLYPPQPTHENGAGGFLETYCIVAQEAMAARCMIVSRKGGALQETIKHAIWWDDKTDIVDVLTNKEKYWKPTWTEKNYQWAIGRTWVSLAAEWAKELTRKEEEEKTKELATV